MRVNIILATEESKQFLQCIENFDLLYPVVAVVAKDKRINYQKIISIYESANKIFLDFEKYTRTVIKLIVKKFKTMIGTDKIELYTQTIMFQKFNVAVKSKRIMLRLIRACEILDKFYIYISFPGFDKLQDVKQLREKHT
jgi:hypothetical protein